ncbi:MAG: BrnA antitoxin of type toxin-antitoxin system [Acidobacteriaceae bacterium]|nr:BrnA antitoxin of type toxin-antitoxin system [Acidobacteriaceae bacterium]
MRTDGESSDGLHFMVHRALTDDILVAMRPARETFPELAKACAKRKRGERGPQKKPRKVLISLRVEAGTAFKAQGRGYQTRMAAVLKKHAKQP